MYELVYHFIFDIISKKFSVNPTKIISGGDSELRKGDKSVLEPRRSWSVGGKPRGEGASRFG